MLPLPLVSHPSLPPGKNCNNSYCSTPEFQLPPVAGLTYSWIYADILLQNPSLESASWLPGGPVAKNPSCNVGVHTEIKSLSCVQLFETPWTVACQV